ncbi:MAG TPA: PTS glucose transporter subunit IIA [Erysipelothrix sp.]|nr:PTS glucose transporter subunit IIA [Erysipelothrix sp.]
MWLGKKKKNQYVAFMSGQVVPLESVDDQVFSTKMMGDGYAIEPTDSEVVSPIDGEITVAFPTGHAYGIVSKQGVEILLHLGIDTVELDGKGFTPLVSVGDKVKAGQTIAKMDLDVIKEAGKPVTSMHIFTSGETVEILKVNENVNAKDEGIIEIL